MCASKCLEKVDHNHAKIDKSENQSLNCFAYRMRMSSLVVQTIQSSGRYYNWYNNIILLYLKRINNANAYLLRHENMVHVSWSLEIRPWQAYIQCTPVWAMGMILWYLHKITNQLDRGGYNWSWLHYVLSSVEDEVSLVIYIYIYI